MMFLVAFAISAPIAAQTRRPPPPPGSRVLDSPADRQADHLRHGVEQVARSRGYKPGPLLHPHVTDFEVRGSSQAVPWGSSWMTELQLKRPCTEGQQRSTPNCLRFDVLEVFTRIDSVSGAIDLGVIPHTFIGSDPATLLEVGASSDVVGDAEVAARRNGGRVVTAIPWPIPQPTPPSQ